MRTLYLLGDSTCAKKKPSARPETGWGETFAEYLSEGWTIDNRAVNGRSTRSFIDEGLFDAILESAKSGDYAMIQFGHNDPKTNDNRFAAPFTDYVENLVYMATSLTLKGVGVCMVTSIARRQFDINGNIKQTHGEYPYAMHYAAFRAGVPCVGLTTATMLQLEKIGEENSRKYYMNLDKGVWKNYPEGKDDNTHLTPEGAKWVSRILASELARLNPRPSFLRPDITADCTLEDVSGLEIVD